MPLTRDEKIATWGAATAMYLGGNVAGALQFLADDAELHFHAAHPRVPWYGVFRCADGFHQWAEAFGPKNLEILAMPRYHSHCMNDGNIIYNTMTGKVRIKATGNELALNIVEKVYFGENDLITKLELFDDSATAIAACSE